MGKPCANSNLSTQSVHVGSLASPMQSTCCLVGQGRISAAIPVECDLTLSRSVWPPPHAIEENSVRLPSTIPNELDGDVVCWSAWREVGCRARRGSERLGETPQPACCVLYQMGALFEGNETLVFGCGCNVGSSVKHNEYY